MRDDHIPSGDPVRGGVNAPVAVSDVAETTHEHGDRFAVRYRHLSEAVIGNDYRIGVVVEELPPGKQTSPAHWHTREEEHVLVLSGTMTVRIGRRRHVIAAGDYVAFPAGIAEEHCLYNHSDEPCRYLLVGNRDPDDVCVYPDSNKISVRALRQIYDKGATRDYYDGEDGGF